MTTPTDPLDAPADEAVQVEAAESELRRLGLDDIRVRHHGDLARLEAPHHDLAGMAAEPCAARCSAPSARRASARWPSTWSPSPTRSTADRAPRQPGAAVGSRGPARRRGNKWQLVVGHRCGS
nr:hypothetical protein GCM10025730_51610 [Promicromonospora thailandica]